MRGSIDEIVSSEQRNWLVTGVAGFIGSNLLEYLLLHGQKVVGLDNFSTGSKRNLEAVKKEVGPKWEDFNFIEGDVSRFDDCQRAVSNAELVLHQAALGSVPRSIKDPINSNLSNVSGFLNMVEAAKNAEVHRFVYAASSSTYGDSKTLPKMEDNIGRPLSPYAVTKFVNELYASVFKELYDLETIGLRYFNVFGYRQDPDGAYAAVIPKWVNAMLNEGDVVVNGDGETSRDFTFVENVIDANMRAALLPKATEHEIYNVACGEQTSLNDLVEIIRDGLRSHGVHYDKEICHREFRQGDVRHSLADISRARKSLDYEPRFTVKEGMRHYLSRLFEGV